MSRTQAERIVDVRRLLGASAAVFLGRARLAPEIARTSGLSAEGVELGFASLEREASDEELRALVASAGDAPHVHVVLSANVFVAPLRALALARAAAPRVTVRPSVRDPILTHALVAAAGDAAIEVSGKRDVTAVPIAAGGEIHVYGRDETIAEVVARVRGRPVTVRGHGAGMGIAVVTRAADLEAAAEHLACDVIPFDQRGCMSPRIVVVEGGSARGEAFASALHRRLDSWSARVPRGVLSQGELADSARWRDSLAFAGRVWAGAGHAVGFAPEGAPVTVPPPGRHVHVAPLPSMGALGAWIGPIAPFVVSLGSDDVDRVRPLAPPGARVVALGRMQHPALDGPVDARAAAGAPARGSM